MAYLTRTDPSRNIKRFYVVDITPTLFGECCYGWKTAETAMAPVIALDARSSVVLIGGSAGAGPWRPHTRLRQ